MENNESNLLIIIPAYNEGENIGSLLEALKELQKTFPFDVLVINDASKDNTARIVRASGFGLINFVYNMGYGSCLLTGYKYAARHGYKYVIQMDADGQHDPCNIIPLYTALCTMDGKGRTPDIVIGSRFLDGAAPYKCGRVRRMAMKLFSHQIRRAAKTVITDPTSGLQGLSHRAFTYYQEYNHFDERYPDANMIMQMLLLGFNVSEIPAVMHMRTSGVSMHSGLRPVFYMIRMMFCIMAVEVRIRTFHVDMGVPDRLSKGDT